LVCALRVSKERYEALSGGIAFNSQYREKNSYEIEYYGLTI